MIAQVAKSIAKRSRNRWIEGFIIGLCAVFCSLPTLVTPDFCLDDAYIHLSYLKSIHLGQGISYNPNDWETGVSSPLWLILLSAWPWLPSVFGIKLLGSLLHAAGSILAAAVARQVDSEQPPRFALATGLLWATTPLALQGATSGMEVSLATACALGFTWLLLRERHAPAALFAALAYLARPELLVFVLTLAGLIGHLRQRVWALLPAGGALGGLAIYSGYCLTVSGHIWPNTYYVKSGGLNWSSLEYLMIDVMRWQPTVFSVTGLALAGYGLYRAIAHRRLILLAVFFATFTTLVAIAISRKLYPGVQFYQSRYFVVALWGLPLLCAYGLTRLPRLSAVGLMLPVVLLTGYLIWQNTQLQLAQERGVRRLHIEPAQTIARNLPEVRVLGVEGAGALRYFLPRTIEVVDLMGLNRGDIAHLEGSFYSKLCYLDSCGVTHLAYPAQWRQSSHRAFVLEDLARFTEPAYAQVIPKTPWQLSLARVHGPKPQFAAFCKKETKKKRPKK